MLTKRVFAWLLSLSLVLNPVLAAPAPTQTQASQPDHALALSRLKELGKLIDRRAIDLTALGESLDLDAEQIIEFVSDEIVFEQYPGLLRGPLGTLMSRAGNALDQATLLASLLKDAGLDARIARTSLSQPAAEALLARMTAATPGEAVRPVQRGRLESLLDQLDSASLLEVLDNRPAKSSDHALVIRATRMLEETLLTTDKASENSTELLEEARHYYWVQYREGSAQPWQDAHPALGGEAFRALGPLTPEAFIADTIPEELQHRFRLRMFIEVRNGDRLESTQIMPDWERPAANLTGQSFSLLNMPDGLKADLFAIDITEAINASQLFVPLFNGKVMPGTLGFDLDGQLYDMEAQGLDSFGATAVFRTAGQKTSRAVSALGALGRQDDTPQRARDLTAQWIEYTLIAPGGEEKTTRRYIFDRIGPAARAKGQINALRLERPNARELLAGESFIVAPGRVPSAMLLQAFTESESIVVDLSRQLEASGKLSMRTVEDAAGRGFGPDTLDFLALVRLFDNGLETRQGTSTYRHEPSVIATHWGIKSMETLSLSTDIVFSNRRAIAWRDGAAARHALLQQSVWESLAEGHLIQKFVTEDTTLRTNFTLFDDAASADELRVLRDSSQLAQLTELGMGADEMSLIAAALDKGLAVVVLPGQDPARLAWWQIDSTSGAVIGYLPNGRGATAVEYLVVGGLALLVVSYLLRAAPGCIWQALQEQVHCASLTKKSLKSRTEENFAACILSQGRWNRDPLPPLSCVCGGIGEPACN